jgi:hypothetical protein
VRSSGPKRKQHRALEHEGIDVLGLAEPIEQPLESVPDEDEVEVLLALLRQVQEPLANGRGQVLRVLRHYDTTASR